MKKSLVYCLIVVLLVAAYPVAMADNARNSGLYTYEFKGNGTVTITGFDWENNTDNIYIPALIDGYPVTAIGDKAFTLSRQSKVNGNYVVTLSSGITSIGDFAFQNAPVNTINIPDSTIAIGKGALLANPDNGYIHFNVTPSHPTFATIDGVLFNKQKRELIAFPTIRNNKELEYTVPEGIQSIADYAFFNRKGTETIYITLPATVKSIGAYAFADGEVQMFVSLNDSIESIDEGAFSYSPYIYWEPANLHVRGVKKLSKISIIPSHCFEGTFWDTEWKEEKTAFTIPASVKQIGDYAFSGFTVSDCDPCELIIPGTVKSIGKNAFNGMKKDPVFIKSDTFPVVISSGVEQVDDYAFANISFITSVLMEEGLTSIGEGAFSNCSLLASVTVPSTVTSIGQNAFDKTITTLTVVQGSFAERYAIENGIQFKYVENESDLSWLYGDTESTETEEETTDWLNQ